MDFWLVLFLILAVGGALLVLWAWVHGTRSRN